MSGTFWIGDPRFGGECIGILRHSGLIESVKDVLMSVKSAGGFRARYRLLEGMAAESVARLHPNEAIPNNLGQLSTIKWPWWPDAGAAIAGYMFWWCEEAQEVRFSSGDDTPRQIGAFGCDEEASGSKELAGIPVPEALVSERPDTNLPWHTLHRRSTSRITAPLPDFAETLFMAAGPVPTDAEILQDEPFSLPQGGLTLVRGEETCGLGSWAENASHGFTVKDGKGEVIASGRRPTEAMSEARLLLEGAASRSVPLHSRRNDRSNRMRFMYSVEDLLSEIYDGKIAISAKQTGDTCNYRVEVTHPDVRTSVYGRSLAEALLGARRTMIGAGAAYHMTQNEKSGLRNGFRVGKAGSDYMRVIRHGMME